MSTALVMDEEKRRVAFATLLSLVLHLLLAIFIAFVFALSPARELPKPLENEVEIVMAPPDSTQYVETTEAQRGEKPEDPKFESDKDTRAASSAPAASDVPMPSQEGREDKYLQFEDRRFSLGEQPAQEAQQASQAQPVQEKLEEVEKPKTTELAMLDPEVRQQQPKKPQEAAENRPAKPATPGYRPEARTTRIKGGISNQGRTAVDAAATPLGKYRKAISDAIGSRWYYYVNQRMDLLSIGTVEIRFSVEPDGKARKPRVLSNSSNDTFATVSIQSILDAKIPPIPEDVAAALDGGRLEIDYTFTILTH